MPASGKRRLPRRLRGRARNWAVAAGLACLGSFVAADACAVDYGVYGGGGGGGGGSSVGGGGGGGGALVVGGTVYNGDGGLAGDYFLFPGLYEDPDPGIGTYSSTPITSDFDTITIGSGGQGGDSSAYTPANQDGRDGNASELSSISTASTITAGSIEVIGGGGGAPGLSGMDSGGGGGGGDSNAGGQGGAFSTRQTSPGGAGRGDGGTNFNPDVISSRPIGGEGGAAIFSVGNIYLSNSVLVKSGGKGEKTLGGKGGDAEFHVTNTLYATGAANLDFTVRDGAVDASIANLDTGANNVTLTFDETVGATAIGTMNLGNLSFDGGNTLTLTRSAAWTAGFTAAGNITVKGKNSVFTSAVGYDANILAFTFDSATAAGDVMLDASGNQAINLSNTTMVQLTASGALSGLTGDDTITLVKNVFDSTFNPSYGSNTDSLNDGIFTYNYNSYVQGSDLLVRLKRSLPGGNPNVPIGWGPAAVLSGINSGFDRIVGSLRDNSCLSLGQPFGCGWQVQSGRAFIFADLGFDSLRIGGSSHVNTDYWSGLVGVGTKRETGSGLLFGGAFLEGGYGDYDSYGWYTGERFRGRGDSKHFGGGVLARLTLKNCLYVEGSLRLGMTWNDLKIRTPSPSVLGMHSYDSNAMYWGGHLGAGKLFALTGVDSIETYGRLYYTRVEKDNTRLRSGYDLRFSASESVRSRLGFRYARTLTSTTSVYGGAAWEYEFKGKVKTHIDGYRSADRSLRGHSGIAEAGVRWGSSCTKWEVDLKGQASIGKRRGLGGSLSVGYGF